MQNYNSPMNGYTIGQVNGSHDSNTDVHSSQAENEIAKKSQHVTSSSTNGVHSYTNTINTQSVETYINGVQQQQIPQSPYTPTPKPDHYVSSRTTKFQAENKHIRPLKPELRLVTFLLACETERLYEEVHQWRSKAKFYEAQTLDRHRYDQLMEEVGRDRDNLRLELNEALAEIDRLKGINQKLMDDLVNARKEHKEHDEQTQEQIRKYIEDTRAYSELQTTHTSLQSDYEKLKSELGRLNQINDDRQVLLDKLQNESELQNGKYTNLFTEHQRILSQVEEFRQLIDRLRNEYLYLLSNRYSTAVGTNGDLTQTITQLRQEISKQTDVNHKIGDENTSLKSQLIHLKENLDFLTNAKSKADQEAMSHGNRINDLERLNQELTIKCQTLENNIAKTEEALSSLRALEQKYPKLQSDLSEAGRRHAAQEQVIAQVKIISKQQLKAQLKGKDDQQKDREKAFIEFENKIALMTSELERLKRVTDEKRKEIKNLMDENARLKSNVDQLSSLPDQMATKTALCEELQRRLEQLQQLSKNRDSELNDLKDQFTINEDLKRQLGSLTADLDRQKRQNTSQNQQLQDFITKIKQFEIDNKRLPELAQALDEREQKLRGLQNEYDNLKQVIKNKLIEEETIKNRISIYEVNATQNLSKEREYQQKIVLLSEEIERLQNLVSDIKNSVEEHKQKGQSLQKLLQRSEGQRSDLEKETEQLQERNKSLQSKLAEILQKLSEAEGQGGLLKQLEHKAQSQSKELDRLLQEIRLLNNENKLLKFHYIEYDALQNQFNEVLGMHVLLYCEIDCLRQRLSERESEVEKLRKSLLGVPPIK